MNITIYRKWLLAAASTVALTTSIAAAIAADQGDDALPEILVTAEKRATNIKTTPTAITALSGDSLSEKGITSLEGLMAATPSLSYFNQGPTAAVNIRGIGLANSSPIVAPGVPLYRDGLLAPTLLSGEPFLDMADIEVLRGPQGTLVGANSTGGAVFFNTRSPELGVTDGFVQGEVGNYAHGSAEGAVNIPINDVISMRLAGSWLHHDSYWTDNLPTNEKAPGEVNQYVGRVSILYQPNDKFSALLKLNYLADQDGAWPITPEPGTPPSFGYPTAPYHLSNPDPYAQESDFQLRSLLDLNYKFDDGIKLRSISGVTITKQLYRYQGYTNTSTTTAVSAPFQNDIMDRMLTQEFNIQNSATDRFHWVGGTFAQFWPAHITLSPNTTATVTVNEGTIKQAYAIYGEGGYDVTDQLEVHLGLRETFDHIYTNGGVFLLTATANRQIGLNDTKEVDATTTGRIGVNYKLTPDQFLYAFAAKGAKSGGTNGVGIQNFSPESVWDYELGLKSSWLNGHLRTEIGGFYSDYKNFQLSALAPRAGTTPGSANVNASDSTVKGAEFSLQAHIDKLRIDGNAAYVNSSVNAGLLLNSYLYNIKGVTPSGLQCAPGQTVGCFNFTPYYQSASGVPNPFSPKFTANLGVAYDYQLSDYVVTPRADYSFVSSQWATIFENPVDKLQTRRLLNLSLSVQKDEWQVVAYGTNVTGSYFITGQTAAFNFWNAPAEYGLRVSRSF